MTVGPSPSWRRQVFIVAPFCLGSCCPPELFVDSLGLVFSGAGVDGGLLDSM